MLGLCKVTLQCAITIRHDSWNCFHLIYIFILSDSLSPWQIFFIFVIWLPWEQLTLCAFERRCSPVMASPCKFGGMFVTVRSTFIIETVMIRTCTDMLNDWRNSECFCINWLEFREKVFAAVSVSCFREFKWTISSLFNVFFYVCALCLVLH